ncbi:hypothetical protein PSYPI_49247, partial [Pseudomonas syringae pv. pisi str. 1704B]
YHNRAALTAERFVPDRSPTTVAAFIAPATWRVIG